MPDAPTDTDRDLDDATDANDDEPRDPEEQVRRLDRIRVCLLTVDQGALRRALRGLPAPVLDSVAKAVRVRPPVLRAGSPNVLRRLHDPLLLDTVASAVTDDCLEALREHLGDEADDPSAEAVREAVDAVTGDEYPLEMVRLTLATVAAGAAEASEVCNDLLDGDERFALPDEAELDTGGAAPVVAAAPAARTADADKKAARKARKAEEAERRRLAADQKAAADAKRKAERKAATATSTPPSRSSTDAVEDEEEEGSTLDAEPPRPAGAGGPPVSRRKAALLGDDARDFDVDDALVGALVVAEIWFEGEDPDQPGLEAKRRPCVVVGVNEEQLLVRPGYSEGGRRARDWQSYEVGDWREAGLDKVTYIEAETRRIDRAQAELPPLGRMTALDWNALW